MRYHGSLTWRATVVCALILAVGLAACGSSGSSAGSNAASGASGAASGASASKSITIASVPYEDVEASTALLTDILEKAGYKVNVEHLGSVGLAFAATATGNADLDLEAWLPHTHASYWAQYKGKLTKLGRLYEQHVSTGLVVPKYCPGQSIADLNRYASTYGGRIIGTSPGAGETIETQHAVSAYGLKLSVVPASEEAQDASIKGAVATHKCVVVALWQPEPTWAQFPIRYLTDPKGAYPLDYAYSVGKTSFPKEFPAAARLLAHLTTSIQVQDAMMKRESDGQSPAQAVQPWIQAHPATVKKWVSIAKG